MRMRARAQKRLGAIDQECERNAPFRVKSRCGCSILIGCAASEESGAAANGSLQAEMRVREGRGGREGRCAERVCRVASRDSCEKCGGGAADERILREQQWWWVERSARENCLIWVTELFSSQ